MRIEKKNEIKIIEGIEEESVFIVEYKEDGEIEIKT
jgi:hypothetical protein